MSALLHHNLDRSAAEHPEQEAFRCDEYSITYGQLQQQSARLATLLRESKVQVGDRVAIQMSPSIESAVAVYGIMRAGAAFVPIDPSVSDSRRDELLRAGEIRCLITNLKSKKNVESLLQSESNLQTVVGVGGGGYPTMVFYPWEAIKDFPPCPEIPIGDDAPAYVIFTSGSTGSPKGIVHTHASGHSYARLSVQTYDLGPRDRVANLSPLHFDMSTFGYLSSVLAGSTTVLIPTRYAMLPASLSALIEKEQISVWYSVPFALIQLLQRGVLEQRNLSRLRWVMFGGEPFSPETLNRLRKLWPQAAFSNVYGPAEVNQCTYFHLPAYAESSQDLSSQESLPIGHVWPETETFIVDQQDSPVQPGATGELLVHSTTMMSRYWHGGETDPQTFWIEPESNKRFYRTGDMFRENTDGELLFLGRRDRQVKVRGYRIELDEIEHAISSHPEVAEAATVCVGQFIVGAAVVGNDCRVTESELYHYLAQRLPKYAVPSQLMLREKFPRTSSGKIDRRVLKTELSTTHSTMT